METDTQARNLTPFSLPTPVHLLARSVQPQVPSKPTLLCSSFLPSFLRFHSHNRVLSSHYGPSQVLGAEAAANPSLLPCRAVGEVAFALLWGQSLPTRWLCQHPSLLPSELFFILQSGRCEMHVLVLKTLPWIPVRKDD